MADDLDAMGRWDGLKFILHRPLALLGEDGSAGHIVETINLEGADLDEGMTPADAVRIFLADVPHRTLDSDDGT